MRLGPGPSAPRSPAVPNWRRSPKWTRSCAGSPASISSRATARVAGAGSSSAQARASAERSWEPLITAARDHLRPQAGLDPKTDLDVEKVVRRAELVGTAYSTNKNLI